MPAASSCHNFLLQLTTLTLNVDYDSAVQKKGGRSFQGKAHVNGFLSEQSEAQERSCSVKLMEGQTHLGWESRLPPADLHQTLVEVQLAVPNPTREYWYNHQVRICHLK